MHRQGAVVVAAEIATNGERPVAVYYRWNILFSLR